MTLPAELPNADTMGSTIDRIVYPKMSRIRAETEPRRRLAAIGALKKEMRAAYVKTVKGSKQYQAHMEWADTLRLRSLVVDVRPTVQELYLFRDRVVGKRLRRLMREREKLRARAYARSSPDLERVRFAYPEEFDGSWLRKMGETLGYPSCCVDAYASDREGGRNVEERAAQQIKQAEQQGTIDTFTYFVGYFFPCTPDCDKALSRGREYHERLGEINPSLGELYESMVIENLDRISQQPEVIAKYRARAEANLRKSP
jgi:hypothetical protein